jgi:hypothetical protein
MLLELEADEIAEQLDTQLQEKLTRTLNAMTEYDQCLLVPYFCHAFTAHDLAHALGLAHSTVLLHIKRAIKRTRKRLGLSPDLPIISPRDLGLRDCLASSPRNPTTGRAYINRAQIRSNARDPS